MMRSTRCGRLLAIFLGLLVIGTAEARRPRDEQDFHPHAHRRFSARPRQQGMPHSINSGSKPVIAKEVVKTLFLYEGLTLGWTAATWVAALALQPAKMEVARPFFMLFGQPISHQDFRSTGPVRLVDRLSAHHDMLATRTQHVVEALAEALRLQCLPIQPEVLSNSWAESSLFRILTRPLMIPLKVYFSLKLLKNWNSEADTCFIN